MKLPVQTFVNHIKAGTLPYIYHEEKDTKYEYIGIISSIEEFTYRLLYYKQHSPSTEPDDYDYDSGFNPYHGYNHTSRIRRQQKQTNTYTRLQEKINVKFEYLFNDAILRTEKIDRFNEIEWLVQLAKTERRRLEQRANMVLVNYKNTPNKVVQIKEIK